MRRQKETSSTAGCVEQCQSSRSVDLCFTSSSSTGRGDRSNLFFCLSMSLPRALGACASSASEAALKAMQGRYFVQTTASEPRVYYRITDNWLELTVRFVTGVRGVRDVKDVMSREILRELDAAGIGIASATYDIVGFPPLRIQDGVTARRNNKQG